MQLHCTDGCSHYDDVIMSEIASQITSLTIVYSTVHSGADQSKHQSSASLAFVWEIHRWPVNFPHKWPVTRKVFPFDDVIMPFCTKHDDLIKEFGPYITGSYITIEVGICVLSLVVQIIILNMYHTQGSRPVPGCLLTIAKRHRGSKRVAVTGNDTTRQDNASEISLNDLDHRKVSPTLHDNREHTGKMSSDTASDFVKEDWRYIARVCDAVCFLLFLVVHIILTIGVVSVLLN